MMTEVVWVAPLPLSSFGKYCCLLEELVAKAQRLGMGYDQL